MKSGDSNPNEPNPITPLARGTRVAQYELVQLLGAGGMGEVYLALDTGLDRLTALKFLSPTMATDETCCQRFTREARAAARLNHPSIITVYEVGEYEGRPFIAMEYAGGEMLRSVIASGPIPSDRVRLLARQLCLGLAEAHRAGVVHRDLKPSNIFIDEGNNCKILDFGLALVSGHSRATSPGAVLGTAGYMSPEQAQGKETDHRSDLFSLGVVLYEMLTGVAPFARETAAASVYAIVHDKPQSSSAAQVEQADKWSLILGRLLAKSPGARYQSAEEILKSLDKFDEIDPGEPTQSISGLDIAPRIRGVAVLYLRNLGSKEDEYLSYGITEDLIVDLTRIGSIRVAPMRTILKYRDSDLDLEPLARELDVSLVLDGSIFRDGENIRVSAQLVDVKDGKNLWANRWEEPADRLHLIKASLAEAVASILNLENSTIEATQLGVPEAVDPRAYEYYLQGKYTFDHRQSPRDDAIATGLYLQALKIEPGMLAAKAGLAEIQIFEGKHEEAVESLLDSLEEARDRGIKAVEAQILRSLARCRSEQARWDDSAEFAQEAMEVSIEIGDLAGEAAARGDLIKSYQRRARFDEALAQFDRVLEINRHLHDRDREIRALNMIGRVHLDKGDFEQAREVWQEARLKAQERSLAEVEANCIANLGTTCFYEGDLDRALEYYRQALQMHTVLGDSVRQAVTRHNIGIIQVSRGQYDEALDLYKRVCETYTSMGEKARCSISHNNAAFAQTIIGQSDLALEKLREVLKELRELNYPFAEVGCLVNMGFAYTCHEETTSARKSLREALEVCRHHGLEREKGTVLVFLGELEYLCGAREEAMDLFEQAHNLAESTRDHTTKLVAAAYLAARDVGSSNWQECKESADAVAREAIDFGDPRLVLVARRISAEIGLEHGDKTQQEESRAALHRLHEEAEMNQVRCEIPRIERVLSRFSEA